MTPEIMAEIIRFASPPPPPPGPIAASGASKPSSGQGLTVTDSRSLGPDDIPAKLRCAICSKLAVNSFRLPCCDQAICEDCQATLPNSCPVCSHSPLSPDNCKPHKALRTTIKVFLRTAATKRAKDTPPVTPVEATPAAPSLPAPDSAEPAAAADAAPAEEAPKPTIETPAADLVKTDANGDANVDGQEPGQAGAEKGVQPDEQPVRFPLTANPQETIVLTRQKDQPGASGELVKADTTDQPGEETEAVEVVAKDEAEGGETPANPAFPAAAGFNAMNPAFQGMNFAGGFDQMQMMMAMQNGMAPGGFGNYNMMGESSFFSLSTADEPS